MEPGDPSQPTKASPSSVVHAEEKFGASKPPVFPTFSLEDLIALGVSVVETDDTKLIEIPIGAQKKMAESVKCFGFGTAKALQTMIEQTLGLMGFDGKVQCKVDEKTFAWTAWQKKGPEKSPKEESAGPTPTAETSAVSSEDSAFDNVGLAITALLQQFYNCKFTVPIPGALARLILDQTQVFSSATPLVVKA